MAQNISIRKNIYDSSKFKEVVNTNFSEFELYEVFSTDRASFKISFFVIDDVLMPLALSISVNADAVRVPQTPSIDPGSKPDKASLLCKCFTL